MSSDFPNTPPVGRAFERSVSPPEPVESVQSKDEKAFDKPEFNYNPPEPVPGGQSYSTLDVEQVAREELSTSEQAAFREAQQVEQRFDQHYQGNTELDFNDAALNEQHWTEETGREYADWSREDEDERNKDNTPESAAEFDARMREAFNKRDRDLDRDDHDLQ